MAGVVSNHPSCRQFEARIGVRVRYSIFARLVSSVGSWQFFLSVPKLTYFLCAIYFNTIGGDYYDPKYALPHHRLYRQLGATRSRFLLSEKGEVILEQLELGPLRESTLTRLRLVIHFGKFLPKCQPA